MGAAYTPGLKVSASTLVRKTRRLPLKGNVVVGIGDAVQPKSVVAQTYIPGILRNVRAAEKLGIDADEIASALTVKQGDAVVAGQILAQTRSFFGMFKSEVKCPVDGDVELISEVTGQIGVREKPNPIEVDAYVQGRIAEVLEGEGVVVETRAALIQGIFGVGGERQGAIRIAVQDPGEALTEAHLTEDMAGQVVVGGSNISGAALRRAADLGLAGVVVGAIIDQDLVQFLGYDIGVAITGHEDIGLTLILTEGFGGIRMADRTFRLLKGLEGQVASINGATQIRAGVIRPEIVVPHADPATSNIDEITGEAGAAPTDSPVEAEGGNLDIGTPIRIIREPYFGQLATVAELPPELRRLPSDALVRVLEATLQSGERVTVPRANVEIIES